MNKFLSLFEDPSLIDRRIIFALVLLGVIIPLLFMKGVEVNISPPVQSAHAAVESLQAGQVLLISIDYDATSAPELQPMLEAILDHAFTKGVKVIMMGHLAIGLPLGQMALELVADKYNKKYGEDYVNLGYRPGGQAVIVAMGRDISDMFAVDYRGTPIQEIPVMKGIKNYENIDLLLTLAHGAMIDIWVVYANGRFNQKIIGGTTAVSAPDAYVYLQAKQLDGLIGGLRGAAEYETLIKKPGVGIRGMPAQTVSHFLVILFIVLGNLGYFLTKSRKRA